MSTEQTQPEQQAAETEDETYVDPDSDQLGGRTPHPADPAEGPDEPEYTGG
jgi:hypothetical protein